MTRMELHSHTARGSNLRLLDSINTVKGLVDRAIELGLCGIAITDHEALSAHVQANQYAEKIRESNPDFKIALGNEIYLRENRENGGDYYHFILIAKNEKGHMALREMSTISWLQSYVDRGLTRVPTTYMELERIVNKYPNSLIATTACLGGELSKLVMELCMAEKMDQQDIAQEKHNRIVEFMLWNKKLFGDDFYIECAPACSKEQIIVNQRLLSISKAFDVKMVIGCDAHFLKAEDRYVHKSYLNSKEGEREVDAFYQYAYLQDFDDIFKHLAESNFDKSFIEEMFKNSVEIYNKIENYSLHSHSTIPSVKVKDYPIKNNLTKYNYLNKLFSSNDIYDRYWVNECFNKLNNLNLDKDERYLKELEEEARVKSIISEKLDTNMFKYPVTLQHYIDLFWECGSTVGAGRGSSCAALNHYLLDVTQLDPIAWNLPFFRYMNEERVELGDIDIDIAPGKRPLILQKIKEERGRDFNKEIDDLSKRELGCTLVATFGTETTKNAILTACRGYRSDEYPDGIDSDIGQYLSSLVPQERGFIWTFKELVYGDEKKDRKPVTTFLNEVNQYPGLLDIMLSIEGTTKSRGSHASGVIMFDSNPYEHCAFMRAPNGDVTTQFDLHECEWMGLVKYDFLVTDVQQKLTTAIELLQENNRLPKDMSLKEIYNKYFHPSVLPLEDKDIWKAIENGEVLNCFQFDSDVGSQAVKKIKPHNILELTDANGLMRLMTQEQGQETPMDKYVRYKKDISLWYDEMRKYGLTKEEVEYVRPYFESSYGVPPSQEQMMQMLMDKDICGFSLGEANTARKIVGKKQMSKIPELKQKVFDQCSSYSLAKYVWECGIGPQMGYSFSVIHALAYSMIAFQTALTATKFPSVYWNCACLIVNSGSLEDNSETTIVDIYEPEHQELIEGTTYEDLPDRSGKIKKTSSTDYGKVAKAIGAIRSRGIKVSLIDINESSFSFKPDEKNNSILFGLKGVNKINNDTVKAIVQGRPYSGIKDFMMRCPLKKDAMIALIKGGAFDNIDREWASKISKEPRLAIMSYYIMQISEPKKKLTLQNFNGLMKRGLIPTEMEFQKRLFNFNKYLSKMKWKDYFVFDDVSVTFFREFFNEDKLEIIDGYPVILQKEWKKIYQKEMDITRDWLKDNQLVVLKEFNKILFKEEWDNSVGKKNLSAWEMDSLCFYYHKHELEDVNRQKYGLSDFNNLPYEPAVDYFFKRNGRDIPIYKTYKIIGTVIGKNDNRSSISLLTTTGVVNVKFTKEYYARAKRQISEVQEDGKKKIVEKGWFTRGTMIMVTGFRREDTFVAKTYSKTRTHQLYKINLDENGDLELTYERYNEGREQ